LVSESREEKKNRPIEGVEVGIGTGRAEKATIRFLDVFMLFN